MYGYILKTCTKTEKKSYQAIFADKLMYVDFNFNISWFGHKQLYKTDYNFAFLSKLEQIVVFPINFVVPITMWVVRDNKKCSK